MPIELLIQKSGPRDATNYLYDGFNDVEEVDSGGNMLARYTQDQAIDQPLSELRSAAASHYESDGIGSVTSLTNSTGTLANSYTYDSFGELIAPTGTLSNPFRYTGRDFDAETGLFYFRARYYDPGLGRFIAEDPNGLSVGINHYVYVRNDPTILVDPFGLDSGPWHPPAGIHTKCLPTDTCEAIRGKIYILEKMISSHVGWDFHMRFPRGGNRHSTKIDQLFTQWIDCQELYEEKCQSRNKPCDKAPIPKVAPKPLPLLPILPILEDILEGLGFAAL